MGLALGVVAIVAACAGLTPDEQAAIKRVQIRNVSPSFRCQNLGSVTGSQTSEGAGGMKAKAAHLGGNTLRIDEDGSATVLYCPEFATTTPEAEADP